MTFDLALDEDKSRIEFALAVTSQPFLETVRGIRILGEDRLEVYVDYWHFVEDYIAEYANLTSLSMPWEILAAMDKLVFEERRAAYSDTAAQRFSVPWINLVMDNDTRQLRRTLLGMRDDGAYPAGVFQVGGVSLVTPEEALGRYDAALAWVEEHGMAVISNGPFQLVRYDPPAQFAELLAFRDPTYPFKPGDWYKGAPPTVQFTSVGTAGIGIGSDARVNVSLQAPGQTEVSYLLLDPATGEVVTKGDAQQVSGGQYTIELASQTTAGLSPGLYHLFVVAASDQVSSLAERRVDIKAVTGEVASVATPTALKPDETPSSGGRGFSCSGSSSVHANR